MLRIFKTLIYLCLFFSSLCTAAEEKKVYTVYIVPQFTALEIHKNWIPLLDKLSEATKLKFELKIAPSIPAFEQAVFAGEADFAFMNPYHQVVAKKKQGYIPLIKDETPLEGILLVKKDNPIQKITELNGKEVAFPAPNAFAASLYIRATLAKQGIDIVPRYVKTHSNVYRSILVNDTIAGGGVNNTLQRETEAVKQQLRVLYTTPKSAPHPFSAHPRINKAVRKQMTTAFVQLGADPANAELLNAVQLPKPVPADYSKDYQRLEGLKLEKFFVSESP